MVQSANNLLLAGGTTGTIVVVALCVVGVISVVYGLVRRFSRMSWVAWQLPIVFAATLLLRYLPEGMNSYLRFAVAAGGTLGAIALVLGVGAAIRRAATKNGARKGAHVIDRLLGAITALLDWAVLLAVLGGSVLVAWGAFAAPPAQLAPLFEHAVWQKFFVPYITDVLLVAFLLYAVKGGYRLGLLKSLWAVIALALTFAAIFGAIYLSIRVSFLASLAQKIAGALSSLNPVVARVLGYAIVSLVVFLLFFAVIMILNALVNALVRRIDGITPLRVVGGILLALILFVLALAVACGVYYLIHLLAYDAAAIFGEHSAEAERIGRALEAAFTSSPLAQLFYRWNPFLLIGA